MDDTCSATSHDRANKKSIFGNNDVNMMTTIVFACI